LLAVLWEHYSKTLAKRKYCITTMFDVTNEEKLGNGCVIPHIIYELTGVSEWWSTALKKECYILFGTCVSIFCSNDVIIIDIMATKNYGIEKMHRAKEHGKKTEWEERRNEIKT